MSFSGKWCLNDTDWTQIKLQTGGWHLDCFSSAGGAGNHACLRFLALIRGTFCRVELISFGFQAQGDRFMHVARIIDWLVIIGFLLSVAALYGSAAFLLLRPFIAPKQIVPKLGLAGVLVLVTAALGLVCMAYAYFIEPYQLEVTRIPLVLSDIPVGKPPIRIVQISDLHCDSQARLEKQLPDAVAKQRPDLILFTGDAVNSLEGYPIFEDCIRKIEKIAPTFAVKGDWDFAFPEKDVLHDAGLQMLGQAVVDVRGTKLSLVGAESGASVRKSLSLAPKDLPTIVLFHNPDADIITEDDAGNVDLYVCGHTHGGQIALPIYGALITQSVQGKKYDSGMHRLGKTYVYTNRGIGMEGHFPRMRFFARPELTVFELTGWNPRMFDSK
ncbi:MAG TPA: metallophosphoesterase [Chroococcales cyanobacterium]